MVEVLIAAGPMALPLWAVLLFSISMYPLGFLFGTCSDCCCPPCDYCLHRYKGGVLETESFGCSAPFDSVTIVTGFGDSQTVFNVIPDTEINIDVQVGVDENETPIFLRIRQFVLIFPYEVDECGCFVCAYRIDSYQGDSFSIDIGSTGSAKRPNANKQFLTLRSCSQTSDLLTDDVTDQVAALFDTGATINAFISITINVAECECGACCLDGYCTENVTEFACEDPYGYLGTPKGEWQGVGTDCDPNPCT